MSSFEPLTSRQACARIGISPVQLDYWTLRADLAVGAGVTRFYDTAALSALGAIKQARAAGLPLRAALAQLRATH